MNLDPFQKGYAYDTYFVDPQYGLHTYWDEDLNDQDKLEYTEAHNRSNEKYESDDLITDAHVSDALRYALLDLWTQNPQLADTSPLPNFQPRPQKWQRQVAIIDDQTLPQLQVTPDGLTRFLSLSKDLPLKNQRKKLYFAMFFRELNIEGLVDTVAVKRHSGSRLT